MTRPKNDFLSSELRRSAPGLDSRIAARRFAGAFLMPAETLRAEIGARRKQVSWLELLALKRVFGVSLSALIYLCRELRVFGRSLRKRLCFRAVEENLISQSKVAEVLDISLHSLHHRMYPPFPYGDALAP